MKFLMDMVGFAWYTELWVNALTDTEPANTEPAILLVAHFKLACFAAGPRIA